MTILTAAKILHKTTTDALPQTLYIKHCWTQHKLPFKTSTSRDAITTGNHLCLMRSWLMVVRNTDVEISFDHSHQFLEATYLFGSVRKDIKTGINPQVDDATSQC